MRGIMLPACFTAAFCAISLQMAHSQGAQGKDPSVGSALAAATATAATATGLFRDVALGDVNGDGLLDLAAGSSENAGLKVFLVNSAREWIEDSDNLPTTGTFNGIVLCDVNHDARLDIIAGSADGDGIRVFLHTGADVWQESSSGLPGAGFVCNEIVVRDFNRDGDPDILATFNSYGVRIYEGLGNGAWNNKVNSPTLTGSYWGLVASEWVRNGWVDVIAAGKDDNGLVFWRHLSPFTWNSSDYQLPHTGVYHQLALADVNHDSRLDILATCPKGIQAFSGRESNFPPLSDGLPDEPAMAGIAAGNYPPDAYADLFAGGYERLSTLGVLAYRGLVGSAWGKMDSLATTGTFWGLAIGDIDRDGAEDVAGAPINGGISVWFNDPIDFSAEWLAAAAPSKPLVKGAAVDAADEDRDGATDLLIGTDGFGLTLWRGDGGNTWTDATPGVFPTSGAITEARLEDFDGDFKPDVVAATGDGSGLHCFRNAGWGSWEVKRTGLPTSEIYYSLLLADVNNDALREIVAGRKNVGIEIYRYNAVGGTWVSMSSPLAALTPCSPTPFQSHAQKRGLRGAVLP